jgi:PAS domain S-box-containing protein
MTHSAADKLVGPIPLKHNTLPASLGRLIRETDGRFGSLLQRNPLAIAVVDGERRVLFVNPAFERLFGYTESDAAGRPIMDLTGLPTGGAEVQQLQRQALAGEDAHIVTRRRRKDGTIVDVEMHILPMRIDGLPDGTFGIYRDLSAERRAQNELSHFFQISLDPMCIAGFDGYFKRVNAAFQRVLGHSEGALLKAPLTSFVHPDDRETTLATWARLQNGETLTGLENRYHCADGSYKWLQWAAIPAIETQTVHATARDITAHRLVEQQLREALQMKADFVSFVTHQLRTPLAGIKWMLELSGEASDRDESDSYIGDARESADRLIALVNDLLDVSRFENSRIQINSEDVDIRELTDSVLGDVATLVREKGHDLHIDVTTPSSVVVADSQLVRQVVLNLISNAIKYTPAGGRLRIRIEEEQGSLRWEIQDSGIGIPESARQRLFQKFFRAENAQTIDTEGTGLGLYLVRLIIERFGGAVACDSVMGKGSTFRFTLPRLRKSSDEAAPCEGVSEVHA